MMALYRTTYFMLAAVFSFSLAIAGSSEISAEKAQLNFRSKNYKKYMQFVAVFCDVKGKKMVATYDNSTDRNFTCSVVCNYTINNKPVQPLSCTRTAFARSRAQFLCESRPAERILKNGDGTASCR
jgi:hypothetical protein